MRRSEEDLAAIREEAEALISIHLRRERKGWMGAVDVDGKEAENVRHYQEAQEALDEALETYHAFLEEMIDTWDEH